jgi:hypothetical protein
MLRKISFSGTNSRKGVSEMRHQVFNRIWSMVTLELSSPPLKRMSSFTAARIDNHSSCPQIAQADSNPQDSSFTTSQIESVNAVVDDVVGFSMKRKQPYVSW